ncbi:MAG TPA: AMP-binding protein [Steroidobacteraceae bacterium]|nr:AMP-binding protein [Steroidobacteraceae bacterium]
MSSSYVHGTATVPLLGQTIGAALDRIAAQVGDRDALISCHQNARFTYAELLDEVNRAARGLLALGVQRGDRVGIWSPNVAEWLITQYAAAKVGAILVNVNPAYRHRELEFALRQSGVSVLVMARSFRKTDYIAILLALAPELTGAGGGPLAITELPRLRHVIYLGDGATPGGLAWQEFVRLGERVSLSALQAIQDALQFDDPTNIQYTSGTTGSPKGATLSHHNVLNNGFFVGEVLRYTAEDRICAPVPFYHCFGCVMANLAALTHGAAVIIPAESFDPEATLRAIEAHRCTSIYGVPTMFIAMLGHPSFDSIRLDSLRTGIMAGSPCPIEVMRQVIDRMHVREVTICYGMTETSPVSFQSAVDDPIEVRVSTVGRIHPHLECKIVSTESGEIVARGTQGELCTRGYSVMLGYWDNPEATAEAIDSARWMHSGDLAVMRDDGCVNISGRMKDMIIRGGENIYPREIEELLYSHPKVSEAQVIGLPDLKYGEEVCAWVRLREGQCATEDEIRAFCRSQIATYKIPRYVRFVTEFPTTVTGKIQKYRMREISIAELGLNAADEIRTA